MKYHFEDFTEVNYRRLLAIAKRNWEFITYRQSGKSGRVCLWRHDIDFSVHRACRLAHIEQEEGVRTTYFVNLHSEFYNVLEKAVAERIARLVPMGHQLGLHFDKEFYGNSLTARAIGRRLRQEQQCLEMIFGTRIEVFSWHNPEVVERAYFDQRTIADMINASGRHLSERFHFVSDSNGYWRFERLEDVLTAGAHDRIHVLTHPGWWTPKPMSPRNRIARCIRGRASHTSGSYDAGLRRSGRRNVR